VGVFFGGAAVGGPAGVADSEGAVDGAVGKDRFEVAELAGGSAELHAVWTTGYGDAGGVVAAVLEAAQTFDDDGDDRFRTDVSDDSTHTSSVDGGDGIGELVDVGLLGERLGIGQMRHAPRRARGMAR